MLTKRKRTANSVTWPPKAMADDIICTQVIAEPKSKRRKTQHSQSASKSASQFLDMAPSNTTTASSAISTVNTELGNSHSGSSGRTSAEPQPENGIDHKYAYAHLSLSLMHGPSASSERPGGRGKWYMDHRTSRLAAQRLARRQQEESIYEYLQPMHADADKNMFAGVRAYFDPGTESTEYSYYHITKLFELHGGNSNLAPAKRSTTHIICSNLCASKHNRVLASLGGKLAPIVVRPAWILDSLKTGRRLPEEPYRIVRDELQPFITDCLKIEH